MAIQTQCCLSKRDDEWEDDDGDGAQEPTAVQLVEPMPWHGRAGGGFAGAPDRPGRGAQVPQRSNDHCPKCDPKVSAWSAPFKYLWT